MKKLLIIIFILTLDLVANTTNEYIIEEQNLNGKTIFMENDNFKILKFNKTIIDIRISKADTLSVTYVDTKINPHTEVKIFAKKIGLANALITFSDNSTMLINFNITADIRELKILIENIANEVTLTQINKSIILKGKVLTNKIKKQILDILKDTLPNIKVIDLIELMHPDKMVRLKLYVAEINNHDGETIKNNWSLTGFNDGKTSVDLTAIMLNAVTLSGGITAAANVVGDKFNTGLTLNYLKSNGVANILDETTLITLENKASEFLAGGTLLVETAGVSADGQPISTITEINYGLELNINVKDIINDKYINLEIDTSSSTLDASNGVGLIPAKKDKSVKTNVVVEDKSTIVLGGLINSNNSQDFEKIPLLGDIPILGKLFQSKNFQEGNSELIFFITPTIVQTDNLNQVNEYKNIKTKIIDAPKASKDK